MVSSLRLLQGASFCLASFYFFIFVTVLLGAAWYPTCSADTISSTSTSTKSKMAMPGAPIIKAATAKHTATVIFLHGLGDTGHGWTFGVQMWKKRGRLDEVKWVLPNAPAIPITAAGRMSVPGWFDINALNGGIDDIRNNQDEPGLLRTREYVHGLIQAEIDAGIPSDRIIVGGFSQGGAMSLLSGLTAKVKLGGVIGLSCWLPIDNKFPSLVQESDLNHETPIFMAHGTADPVVPTALGQLSYEVLKKQNFPVTMKLYTGMPHTAFDEELDEVEAFIHSRLPPQEEEKKSEL